MDDANFLEQCGISLDPEWMVELRDRDSLMDQKSLMEQESLTEQESISEVARNYAMSLIRIANMLGQSS